MKMQLTLGELIKRLERAGSHGASVVFDFVHMVPGGLCSYRGYYDQLALMYSEPARGNEVKVSELVEQLKAAVGATFEGYKGGSYLMNEDTEMWVANYGDAPGTAIVDVLDKGWKVVIETEDQD